MDWAPPFLSADHRSTHGFPGRNVQKTDRPEIPNIDANIELSRQWLQPAVAMPVEVDRALSHVAPRSEWVVAEHELLYHQIDGQFRIRLDALPAGAARDHRPVVVANDEVLPAMQRRQ
jgi:hypothetical protein